MALSYSDWGSLLAGYSIGSSAAEYDGYLIKLDKCGEMLWAMNYGGPVVDSISDVAIASDGSVVFVGQWTNAESLNAEVMLVRVDQTSGALQRGVSYSLVDNAVMDANGMILNADGSALIFGVATTSQRTRALVMLVDFSGIITWSYSLGSDGVRQSYYFNDATRLTNGDYILVGYANLEGKLIGIVSRISFDGERSASSQWGAKHFDTAYSVASCRDGGYIVAASSRDATDSDSILLLRFQSTNELLWVVSIGGVGQDVPSHIVATHDDGFVIVGSTTSYYGSGSTINTFPKGIVIKVDSSGGLQWAKAYGKGGYYKDVIVDVVEMPGGGFRIVGSGYSYRASLSSDAFVVQLTPSGDLIEGGAYWSDIASILIAQSLINVNLTTVTSQMRYVDGLGGDITSKLSISSMPRQHRTFTSDICMADQYSYSPWPSHLPSIAPSSSSPSYIPSTALPSSSIPSLQPSSSAPSSSTPTSSAPSFQPSTTAPTPALPTQSPSSPSSKPTPVPSILPGNPTPTPTLKPTSKPSKIPTTRPTGRPSARPSSNPSHSPSVRPTLRPSTFSPTRSPALVPTRLPTSTPSSMPSRRPSRRPTPSPTIDPTPQPTKTPVTSPPTDMIDISKITGAPTSSPTSAVEMRSAGANGTKANIGYAIMLTTFVIFMVYFLRSFVRWYVEDKDFSFSDMIVVIFGHTHERISELKQKSQHKIFVSSGATLTECIDPETGLTHMVYLAPVPGAKETPVVEHNAAPSSSTSMKPTDQFNADASNSLSTVPRMAAMSESALLSSVDGAVCARGAAGEEVRTIGARIILSDIDSDNEEEGDGNDDSSDFSDSVESYYETQYVQRTTDTLVNAAVTQRSTNSTRQQERNIVILADSDSDDYDSSSASSISTTDGIIFIKSAAAATTTGGARMLRASARGDDESNNNSPQQAMMGTRSRVYSADDNNVDISADALNEYDDDTPSRSDDDGSDSNIYLSKSNIFEMSSNSSDSDEY
jgi:hypothetical protein